MAENSQQVNRDKAEKKKTFGWSVEETALLLQVVLAYNTTKLPEGKDWETTRVKYEDIKQNFALQYQMKKAVGSGKISGGGRVVYSLYDECYQIWAGCPAAECINDGIETEFVNNSEDKNNVETNTSVGQSDSVNNIPEKDNDSAEEDNIIKPIKKTMRQSQDTMMVDLRGKRNSRSIKQVGFQDQMLARMTEEAEINKEELKIQKEIAEQLRNSEKQFLEAMQAISADDPANAAANVQQLLAPISTAKKFLATETGYN
eukprot:gene11473-12669_t